jgi:hydrolase, TatD family
MKLIDTHCHLFVEEFDDDREALVTSAIESGIEKLLIPNIDDETIERLHAFCDKHPGFAYPMMGLHPTSVDTDYAKRLSAIESCLSKTGKYCAIGEIGIDLYWDKTFLKEQKFVFEQQLRWSIDLSLPVSIHTRDAFPEVFDSLHKVGADKLSGVFHCFSGTEEELNTIKTFKNFKIGINGVVTFKKSPLPEVLKGTDISKIVLETDAPYLAPTPYRGKRNIPEYIGETAKKIAEIYSMPLEEVAAITSSNAQFIFQI